MATYVGQVIGGTLNLRAEPRTSAARLAQIPNGAFITVEAYPQDGDWLHANYDGKDGFVMAAYVKPLEENPVKLGVVTGGKLNMREGPSSSSKRLLQIPDKATIQYVVYDKDWLNTSYNNISGFVMSQYVTPLNEGTPEPPPPVDPGTPVEPPAPPTEPEPEPDGAERYGLVTAIPEMNVRGSASTSGRILGYWQNGRIGYVSKHNSGWFKSFWKGTPAYLSADFIDDTGAAPADIPSRIKRTGANELGLNDAQAVRYYGSPSVTTSWCQIFANFMPMHAGMPQSMVPSSASTPKGVIFHVNDGNRFWFGTQAHKDNMRRYSADIKNATVPEMTQEEKTFIPRVGDFVYYCWTNSGDNVSHVGLVYDVDSKSGTFTALEGNKSNKVGLREKFAYRNNSQIVGFGRPDYEHRPRASL